MMTATDYGAAWRERRDNTPEIIAAFWKRRFDFRLPLWEDVGIENGQGPIPIKAALARFEQHEEAEIGNPLDRFGDWFVTDFGVECPWPCYWIPKDRIHETDWYAHMYEKSWVIPEHFGCALHDARRRARINREREVSKRMRFSILKRDEYRCQLCGATASSGAVLEVDHKIPVSDGGTSVRENLWTLCLECNRGKGASAL